MRDPGRRVLTRVGLRIPASICPENHRNGRAEAFEQIASIAATAERSGFDSIWVTDPVGEGPVPPEGIHRFEAYTLLGALSTRTRTATLGAMVSPVTARNPAVLAKIVTGVDVLSGGRAVLGLGMGAPGAVIGGKDSATGDEPSLPHLPAGARVDSLAEGLHICRAMFTEEAPSFEGRYYRIREAQNRPRPIRAEGIPILVDGEQGEGAGEADGLLELVARYADAVTLAGRVGTLRDRLNTLDRLCHEVGRDPAAISRIGTGMLVITPSDKQAVQRLDRAAGNEGKRDDRATATSGWPDALADQVGDLLEVGIDGVVFTVADADDLELVEMAGTTLRPLFE
ncbi:MAG TPA: LLM class flavin-dependent oxidoreductase [Acidimicrobiales bacterium]|nr:LLM class flavin-dependent oxidoreductase [Acidimicrobiales bacterium]